eukprot:TRINITY_DN73901_c0_g1_i1.p1 TRINITY_DN73901_c0_g1~~TRINITY_DN73901_c0_g1_i1.p1  ORF type:complete len:412 (+),score=39.15 TRINITY_DN73901_c0_g1_i1:47-1282(+)
MVVGAMLDGMLGQNTDIMIGGLVLLVAVLCVIYLVVSTQLHPDIVKIKELWTYPIKSCAGVKLEAARMHRDGLQWDREFAIVDMREETNGQVLSQKAYPKLASLWPVLHCTEASPSGERLPCTPSCLEARLDGITLHDGNPSGQSASSVHVDLRDKDGSKPCKTTWSGNTTPLDAVRYPISDAWLTEFLGFPSSLCQLTSRRGLRTTRLAPVADLSTDCCRYQDGAPLTLLSEASVSTVQRRFKPHTLSACRFRPNVLVGGCGPLAESTWARVSVSDTERDGDSGQDASKVGIRMLMDAYRCTMVTIVQAPEAVPGVAEAGSRPQGQKLLPVMKKWYGGKPETHGPLPRDNPNFAVFCAPDQDEAVLRVGQVLTIDETTGGAPSIYAYNEKRSHEKFELGEDRFWRSQGPK